MRLITAKGLGMLMRTLVPHPGKRLSPRGLALLIIVVPVAVFAARSGQLPPVMVPDPGFWMAQAQPAPVADPSWPCPLPPVECGSLAGTALPEISTSKLFPRRVPHIGQTVILRVLATAYSSCVEETDETPQLTATSRLTEKGVVALSRDLLREFTPGAPFGFGDHVEIPGVGRFVVEDTMNPRYRQRVDIWCPTREEALAWGARNVHIRPAHLKKGRAWRAMMPPDPDPAPHFSPAPDPVPELELASEKS